jgi:hypothetical protein
LTKEKDVKQRKNKEEGMKTCLTCKYKVNAGYGEILCAKVVEPEVRNLYNNDLISEVKYGTTKLNKTGNCKYHIQEN